MSGGSYNYLCHTWDIDDLWEKREDLKLMGERLSGLNELEFPGAAAAANSTLKLAKQLELWSAHVEANAEILKDVWKSVEWWDSADWGPDRVKEALDKLINPRPKE